MSNSYYYQKAAEKVEPIMFSDLIKEDLENKRVSISRFPYDCKKCGKKRPAEDEVYFYGKGKRVCIFCHRQAIDWLEYVTF